MTTTAFVICGALGAEVKEIVERRGWDVDIYGLSAMLHLYPARIVEELGEKLRALRPRYDSLVVVYGDCGTAGRLEPVLAEVGASQVKGPHCYEMFAGEDLFHQVSEDRPGTFFLTDWLVRNFDRAVVRGLGLDRDPELKPMLFGNYEALMYLRQVPNPRLAIRAREIAVYLGLPLEIVDVGLGELEDRLAELVGDVGQSVVLVPSGPSGHLPPKRGGHVRNHDPSGASGHLPAKRGGHVTNHVPSGPAGHLPN